MIFYSAVVLPIEAYPLYGVVPYNGFHLVMLPVYCTVTSCCDDVILHHPSRAAAQHTLKLIPFTGSMASVDNDACMVFCCLSIIHDFIV